MSGTAHEASGKQFSHPCTSMTFIVLLAMKAATPQLATLSTQTFEEQRNDPKRSYSLSGVPRLCCDAADDLVATGSWPMLSSTLST
eukprot:2622636-Amphidinium_carterae.1